MTAPAGPASLRVLLVEDVATDAELIEHELHRAGLSCSVQRVEDRQGFLRALEEFAPEIILADYMLPQLTALDTLQLLKASGKSIPFILVTGAQSEEVAVECMREGADDYLLKTSLKRLPSAVLNTIKQHEAEAQKEQAEAALRRDVTERKRAEAQLKQANLELAAREQALLNALKELEQSHEALQAAHLQLMQAEKMDSVGQLAAGVAHEVKNPLAVLLMGVEYLMKRLPRNASAGGEELDSILSDMHEAVKRANGAIRGLLDFSAPRQLKRQAESLNDVIRQALSLVKHDLAKAHIQDVTVLARAVPPLLLDKNKIEQVFVNLFMNAIHAMPQGGTLTVRTSQRVLSDLLAGHPGLGSGGGGRAEAPRASAVERRGGEEAIVVAEVEDTGAGIPEDTLAKIFEPFFTTKPTGKGTGLGLTVTQEIMHLHGGAILIANRAEGGVRVTLVFQASPALEETCAPTGEPQAHGRKEAHPAH